MNVDLFWDHSVKCEFCEATFESQDVLKDHLRLHSRRKPYKCHCGAKFSYNSTLEWHKKSHTGEMPYKCDECGVQFLQNSMLVWHKRKHRVGEASQSQAIVVNIIHQPNVQSFPNVFSLPNLVNEGNTAVANVVSVPTCHTEPTGAVMSTPNFNMNSFPAQHPVPTTSSQSNVLGDVLGKRKHEATEGVFRCDVCGMSFIHSTGLRSHMQTKHNMGENNPFHILARQQAANGQFLPNKKIFVEKPFKCDLCGAGFKTEGHLRTHRRKHVVERPFKCEKCGLTFSDSAMLESHERRHQAERPHKCGYCGASFFRESHLERHLKRHTGEVV